ncbi:hypothetical protein [Roseiconus lacunae]|uniref:hypothetical protein n=1 Tax=Roseiconus lacunae TaxID=2605694 RepID=UPI0013567E3D|nr:hypothetical protein [Roseiconus lacunae]
MPQMVTAIAIENETAFGIVGNRGLRPKTAECMPVGLAFTATRSRCTPNGIASDIHQLTELNGLSKHATAIQPV